MTIPPVRCEIAFSTAPDDPSPAYVDVTSKLVMNPGPSITRGRADEFSTVQPGTCSFALDNSDGRFTAGLASSPYYPNVKLRRKMRITVRLAGQTGNGFSDPSFESAGIVDWHAAGNPAPAIAPGVSQFRSGSQSMKVTWAAGNVFFPGPAASLVTVIGRQYTIAVYVLVPVGNPAAQLFLAGTAFSSAATVTTAAWERLSITFTASTQLSSVLLCPVGSPTAGQICYVDDAMYDEGALATFTTSPMPISYRFTGYVDDWPTEWPGGGAYAEAKVTAVDRFKRLGMVNPFRSLVEQEYLYDVPFAYYTLGESAGSTQVGDTSKNGRPVGVSAQLGAGGTVTLGVGTGPSTDSLTAAVFAPVNTTNGRYFTCALGASMAPFAAGQSVECFFLSSTAAVQEIMDIADTIGNRIMSLSLDATGHLVGSSLFAAALTSAGVVSNGATHHVALTQSISGTTVTVSLYLDGVLVGSNTWTSGYGVLVPFVRMNIGGGTSTVLNGTVSHAACYDSTLSATRVAAHSAAGLTGFLGERSDQRLSRLARYAGIPTSEQSRVVGLSTIALVDITGAAPLQSMQDVTDTESGILQVDGQGRLAFQSRGHRYNTASALTLAGVIDPGSRFVMNDGPLVNDVTASRPGGITYRAVNAASILDYGPARITPSLLTTSDNEVIDAANWKANQTATPSPRLPAMVVDLLGNPSLAAGVLALDISSRVTVSQLPAQAPSSTLDQFIEGWTESISVDAWTFAFNCTPAATSGVWQLDSTTYSQLDTSTRLAY